MGGLRRLGPPDLASVQALLAREPVTNLFVASRVAQTGLNPRLLGCPVWGFERQGQLVALCHAGSNLVPVGDDPAALDAFARQLGSRRSAQSILGRSDLVAQLYQRLLAQGRAWHRPREFRAHQPLLLLEGDPAVPGDDRVRAIQLSEFQSYLQAAINMYTEEVGVNPITSGSNYQGYVWNLIRSGHAFGAMDDAEVWFKSDIGSLLGDLCQIQGVWLAPRLRGRGFSAAAMAAAVRLTQGLAPRVSLYVNDYNLRALRMYRTVGFHQVGELATVLY